MPRTEPKDRKPRRKLKLTEASIAAHCPPPEEGAVSVNGKPLNEIVYWDLDVRGFGIRVRRPREGGPKVNATFFLLRELRARPLTITIGRLGPWKVDAARKRARELVVDIDRGINPNAEKRKLAARGTTLAEARDWHLAAMRAKDCAARSMETVRVEAERYLGDWLRRPLAEITRNECARRHERLTKAHGKAAANRAFWILRACWNTAARRLDDLSPCPVRGVTFNRMRRRRDPIPWPELPAWWAKMCGLSNPVRRDWQIFVLLTGLRSESARQVKFQHVNFQEGTIHIPKPKFGYDRAFTVPLDVAVLEILRLRHADNLVRYGAENVEGYLFPTRGKNGKVTHVKEPKEWRIARGDGPPSTRRKQLLPSPHRLRDTFLTAAHEARVHPMDQKILVNHALPGGDVTEGYIRPSVEHLRGEVARITELILGHAGVTVAAGRNGR